MEERLIHYSAKPLTQASSRDQKRSPAEWDSTFWKPRGLWVSVEGEDDWKQWCEAEQFSLNCFEHATQIILTPNANILRLTTPQELKTFSAQHSFNPYPEVSLHSLRGINWEDVAAQHQGIIIAPYHWSCRLNNDVFWYYGWDCASGCIWDASAIVSLIPIEATCPAK